MRLQEHWDRIHYPKIVMNFSPRLQRDIKEHPIKNLPEYGSYYIWGPAGSGKTTMAAQMYIEARKKFYFDKLPGGCDFITVYDLLSNVRSAIDDPTRDPDSALQAFAIRQYLVLDDLGATRTTDWELSQIQILINIRYEQLLTTVITSNHSLEELGEVLGDERIPSRIERMTKKVIGLK